MFIKLFVKGLIQSLELYVEDCHFFVGFIELIKSLLLQAYLGKPCLVGWLLILEFLYLLLIVCLSELFINLAKCLLRLCVLVFERFGFALSWLATALRLGKFFLLHLDVRIEPSLAVEFIAHLCLSLETAPWAQSSSIINVIWGIMLGNGLFVAQCRLVKYDCWLPLFLILHGELHYCENHFTVG